MTTGDRLAGGVASLVAAARTLPMMSPWRVVLVLQAEVLLAPQARERGGGARARRSSKRYFEAPEPQTTLVLVAGAARQAQPHVQAAVQKRATIVECGVIENQADAERWVRTRIAAAGVADRSGGGAAAGRSAPAPDVKRLRGDVDRLLLYALGQTAITVDDVRQIAGPAALQDDWAMTNAIEQRNAADALRQLALMLDAGAPPEKILGQLGWLVRAKFPAHRAARSAPRGRGAVPDRPRPETIGRRAARPAGAAGGRIVRGEKGGRALSSLSSWRRSGASAATCSGRRRCGE